MTISVDIQINSQHKNIPNKKAFNRWVNLAYEAKDDDKCDVTVRIVDNEEMQQLNTTFANKDKPTNVLAFPNEKIPFITDDNALGDIVLCAPVITKEALEQKKREENHWAHLVIHAMLHLQGYDHKIKTDAVRMEEKEIYLLQQLGINNPYMSESTHER